MSNEAKPLHADQRRCAAMLAAGMADKAAAAELKVAPKTVMRWKQREDFRELMRRHRDALMPETITAEAVLTAALSATKRDGLPDWTARINAARAILSTEVASPEAHEAANRVTQIFLAPPEDDPEDDGAPRPFPLEGARANGAAGRDEVA